MKVLREVTTLVHFQRDWSSLFNFLLNIRLIPFSYEFPPLEILVDTIRADKSARILSGQKKATIDETDISQHFRNLPIDDALLSPFQMTHFDLSQFQKPKGLLQGLEEKVMVPWMKFLHSAGFTWHRCFPILFISGPNSATNYHMDLSHVLAWQIYGSKNFHTLREPNRWAPLHKMVEEVQREEACMPPGLTSKDLLTFVMGPGDILWNQLLTPHWVEASRKTAVSLNISHGGLRYRGKLSPQELALEDWWELHPEEIWRGPQQPL